MAKKKVVVDADAAKAQKAEKRNIVIDSVKVLSGGEEGEKRHIIRYQEGGDKKMLESPDPATEEFYRVLQSLADDASDVLEFEPDYRYGLTVKSVKYRYQGSQLAMEACISMVKSLTGTKGTPTFVTPYKKVDRTDSSTSSSEPMDMEHNEFTMHSKGAIARLKALHQHAVDYVVGKRAAVSMFDAEDEDISLRDEQKN